VWFEDQPNVYDSFWGGFDPAARTARANQVLKYLTTPLCEDMSRAVVPDGFCGLLAGFGSGGSSR
jgi:hypothetical protein